MTLGKYRMMVFFISLLGLVVPLFNARPILVMIVSQALNSEAKGFKILTTKLIIFDCDGVLVDSEHLGNQVIADTLALYGHTISSEELITRFKGMKFKTYLDILANETGIELPESFETELRQNMSDAFKGQVKPIKGALELIESLKIPFCVASNGPLKKTEENLQTTKLYQHFVGNMFSAYEVGHWKPDPGLFLAAAQHFNVEPKDCIVIEDSLSGVKAAIAGGMTVFALDHTQEDESLHIANRVFGRLAEIQE